jgi:predicted ester cyclase
LVLKLRPTYEKEGGNIMSEKENKVLMRQFYDGMNKGDSTIWDKLCAPGYIFHHNTGDYTAEQSKQYIAATLAALPDTHASIDDMIAEGDKVAVRYTIRGTHKGAFRGIAPTGKQVTVNGFEINRFAGGKFVETWGLTDYLSLLQQLGAIPTAPPKK